MKSKERKIEAEIKLESR